MRTTTLAVSLSCLLAGAACSSSSTADGGPDTGVGDAGASDAGGHDGGAGDAAPTDGGDVVVCTGAMPQFPTFDRTCSVDADCAIGAHTTDCCGTIAAMGIAATEQARFAADEATCDAMYPACGCASNGVVVDDGTRTTGGLAAVSLACVAHVCTTSARPETPCGAVTCTSTQVCVSECSGIPLPDAGPLPSHCVDVPAECATSTDCACFGGNPCPTGSCVSVSHGVPLCLCA